MFKVTRKPRVPKNKAQLSKESSIGQSSGQTKSAVSDWSVLLYIVRWLKKDIRLDFLVQYRKKVEGNLKDFDVYLVFNRYQDFSWRVKLN